MIHDVTVTIHFFTWLFHSYFYSHCYLAATAPATPVSINESSKMNPKQVAALLKAHGASDETVAAFLDNDISGQVIVDGLSDDDLVQIGFTGAVQRPGIRTILKLIISHGLCSPILIKSI